MCNKSLSIITIVHNRETHLLNLIKGLENGSEKPGELVVVRIGEPAVGLVSPEFEIVEVELIEEGLPLAKARNLGSETARGELLIYLDVDCIPCWTMVTEYLRAFHNVERNSIIMGQVRYLPSGVPSLTWNGKHASLETFGEYHKIRPRMQIPYTLVYPNVNYALREHDYTLFWSLTFALYKDIYNSLGGFDENYKGWGGEDTDFAFKIREANLPLYWNLAEAMHQHHEPSHNSEKNVQSIVDNANYFYSKWAKFAMLSFLDNFKRRGLVELIDDKYYVIDDA